MTYKIKICDEEGCEVKATSTISYGVAYADYCDEHAITHEADRQAALARARQIAARRVRRGMV